MRKLLLSVVAAATLLVLAGCGGEGEEPAEAGLGTERGPEEYLGGDEDQPDAYTGHFVFVTEHGDKYHAPYCQHVRGKQGLRRLTREEAALEGYEACKVCNPGPPR
jgi:hypothetical protein